eukprot:TRINITY_DN4711_c0_g1_i1.p1 TRINITY_DN4711_c0_g1~~TRINITY_DN4711_c0_g1_i1.p1  ORF type:complete len:694 (+),score=136.48 TRINITY_DN4711_c0_g1_i1:280-2361(+)
MHRTRRKIDSVESSECFHNPFPSSKLSSLILCLFLLPFLFAFVHACEDWDSNVNILPRPGERTIRLGLPSTYIRRLDWQSSDRYSFLPRLSLYNNSKQLISAENGIKLWTYLVNKNGGISFNGTFYRVQLLDRNPITLSMDPNTEKIHASIFEVTDVDFFLTLLPQLLHQYVAESTERKKIYNLFPFCESSLFLCTNTSCKDRSQYALGSRKPFLHAYSITQSIYEKLISFYESIRPNVSRIGFWAISSSNEGAQDITNNWAYFLDLFESVTSTRVFRRFSTEKAGLEETDQIVRYFHENNVQMVIGGHFLFGLNQAWTLPYLRSFITSAKNLDINFRAIVWPGCAQETTTYWNQMGEDGRYILDFKMWSDRLSGFFYSETEDTNVGLNFFVTSRSPNSTSSSSNSSSPSPPTTSPLAFASKYRECLGVEPDEFSAAAVAVGYAIGSALRLTTNGTRPTNTAEGLSRLRLETFFGAISFGSLGTNDLNGGVTLQMNVLNDHGDQLSPWAGRNPIIPIPDWSFRVYKFPGTVGEIVVVVLNSLFMAVVTVLWVMMLIKRNTTTFAYTGLFFLNIFYFSAMLCFFGSITWMLLTDIGCMLTPIISAVGANLSLCSIFFKLFFAWREVRKIDNWKSSDRRLFSTKNTRKSTYLIRVINHFDRLICQHVVCVCWRCFSKLYRRRSKSTTVYIQNMRG